jgi:hypothetical protein
MSRRWLGLFSAVAGVALAAPALGATATDCSTAGFCRTKACDNQAAYDDVWQTAPDPPCDRDPFTSCLLQGQPLYWPQRCISFSVQKDGSPKQGISFEQAHDTVTRAFSAWQNADCGGGATPSFTVKDFSPAVCSVAQYNQDGGNANIFVFRDKAWPYAEGEDTLALTTITYNTENAQIYDADVEINSAQATFTFSDDSTTTKDDLLSVLTHECGHFLGLSHDALIGSTMFPRYIPGDLYQRTLDGDDTCGICAIFPPGESFNADACEPRHGFSRECGSPQKSGCALSERGVGSAELGALGVLLGLGLVARRRRRAG